MLNAVSDRRGLEKDRELINELYSTYLITETIISVNAVDKKGKPAYKGQSFKKYLKNAGLGDLVKRNLKVNRTDKETAINKANKNVIDAVKAFSKGGE